MNAQEWIEWNNEKRKELTKENLKYYEDMIVYIRLSFSKSEKETEEILSELLDHLLDAQKMGKSAIDVFGENPKKFADEIIGELPKMVTKERTLSIAMGILNFLAAGVIVSGIWNIINHYFLHLDGIGNTFYLGTLIVKTLISIPIAFVFIYFIIQLMRWTCFRKISKVAEFMLYFLCSMLSIGIFVVVYIFIPDFGYVLEVPTYMIFLLGIVLYVAATFTRKAISK
jgi:uncharacterized membrane-anchored protein